jgi:protoporphyrin/coproporphyrin ferrochelatase
MALRHTLSKFLESMPRAGSGGASQTPKLPNAFPVATRQFASHAPPVTQSSVGSKGPTAMVFLNMGGPSTTDEVGDFLTRLFVRASLRPPRVTLPSI